MARLGNNPLGNIDSDMAAQDLELGIWLVLNGPYRMFPSEVIMKGPQEHVVLSSKTQCIPKREPTGKFQWSFA